MGQDQPAAPDVPPKSKTRPQKPLPTERITFKRQLDLLRAYGSSYLNTGKPVGNLEAAKLTGMTESTSSIANAFFTATGLLQRGQDAKFTPSSEVVDFAKAHQWNPATSSEKLKPILARTWFAEALMPKVHFAPVDEAQAIEVLALEASAGPEYRSQVSMLIDYLEAGGLVTRDGNLIKLRNGASPNLPQAQAAAPTPQAAPRGAVATTFRKPMEGGVQFSVNVSVDMVEMAGWRPDRISALFAGIAQVLSAKGSIEEDVTK
jgi:hypothetical protein